MLGVAASKTTTSPLPGRGSCPAAANHQAPALAGWRRTRTRKRNHTFPNSNHDTGVCLALVAAPCRCETALRRHAALSLGQRSSWRLSYSRHRTYSVRAAAHLVRAAKRRKAARWRGLGRWAVQSVRGAAGARSGAFNDCSARSSGLPACWHSFSPNGAGAAARPPGSSRSPQQAANRHCASRKRLSAALQGQHRACTQAAPSRLACRAYALDATPVTTGPRPPRHPCRKMSHTTRAALLLALTLFTAAHAAR